MKTILGLVLGMTLLFGVLASSASAEYTEKNEPKKEKSSAYDISDIVDKAISKTKSQDKKTDAKKIDTKKLTKSKGKPQRKIKQN